jgi:hypothetical protein
MPHSFVFFSIASSGVQIFTINFPTQFKLDALVLLF